MRRLRFGRSPSQSRRAPRPSSDPWSQGPASKPGQDSLQVQLPSTEEATEHVRCQGPSSERESGAGAQRAATMAGVGDDARASGASHRCAPGNPPSQDHRATEIPPTASDLRAVGLCELLPPMCRHGPGAPGSVRPTRFQTRATNSRVALGAEASEASGRSAGPGRRCEGGGRSPRLSLPVRSGGACGPPSPPNRPYPGGAPAATPGTSQPWFGSARPERPGGAGVSSRSRSAP